MPPDWLLFGREDALYAQRIDLDGLTTVGDPLLVADRVTRNIGNSASIALSASASGLFAYRTPAENSSELIWRGRNGRQTGTLATVMGPVGALRPSPDGRLIAEEHTVGVNRDIWLREVERGVIRRFTFDPGNDSVPAWSPDGDRKPFVVVQTEFEESGAQFSPDGRWIAYVSNETGRNEVFVHPFPGPGRTWQVSTNGGDFPQ